MKPFRHQATTPSLISDSLNHKVTMYALAASSAAVGVLALSRSADAEIVYTPTHHFMGPNSTYRLDLANRGVADFTLVNATFFFSISAGDALYIKGRLGNSIWTNRQFFSRGSAVVVKKGTPISFNDPFATAAGMAIAGENGSVSHTGGPWAYVTGQYLGLKFQIHGKTHYGWARLSVKAGHSKVTSTITGYAYETVPNKAIVAGTTKGSDVVSVRPKMARGSLGSLALGKN